MHKDEDAWWDALAGNPPADADEALKREAQVLRAAMLRRRAVQSQPIDLPAARARLREVLARNEPAAERSTGGNDVPSLAGRMVRWFAGGRAPRWAMALVLMLAMGAGVNVWMKAAREAHLPPDVVVRDFTSGERNYVLVPDPVKHQSALVAALKARGIAARTMIDATGAHVVQATLGSPADASLRAILVQHGLRNFTGSDLDIAFKAP